MMMRILLALLFMPAIALAQALPFVWTDTTGTRDMPWLGSGGRAKWFERDVSKPWDVMNPRGATIEKRWGASGGSGEDPYATGTRTVAYLQRIGAVKGPYPFRITIVSIEPTVAILRFDLSAVIADPIEYFMAAFPASRRNDAHLQQLASGDLPNPVMFGTRVSARGSLWWFSPDNQPPTPLDLTAGRIQIRVKNVSLQVEKAGDEIAVSHTAGAR